MMGSVCVLKAVVLSCALWDKRGMFAWNAGENLFGLA
jgi:hypothetical protein